jgi:hypothetical protein
VPVQAVDATPFGMKLFSKVVFMKQGRRFGFSAEQKLDVWRRWKAGQTLHEIGRAFGCRSLVVFEGAGFHSPLPGFRPNQFEHLAIRIEYHVINY